MKDRRPIPYVVHVHVTRVKEGAYVVSATADSTDRNAPKIKSIQPCDPCTLAEARAAGYRFVSMLTTTVIEAGGAVVDVVITDNG